MAGSISLCDLERLFCESTTWMVQQLWQTSLSWLHGRIHLSQAIFPLLVCLPRFFSTHCRSLSLSLAPSVCLYLALSWTEIRAIRCCSACMCILSIVFCGSEYKRTEANNRPRNNCSIVRRDVTNRKHLCHICQSLYGSLQLKSFRRPLFLSRPFALCTYIMEHKVHYSGCLHMETAYDIFGNGCHYSEIVIMYMSV